MRTIFALAMLLSFFGAGQAEARPPEYPVWRFLAPPVAAPHVARHHKIKVPVHHKFKAHRLAPVHAAKATPVSAPSLVERTAVAVADVGAETIAETAAQVGILARYAASLIHAGNAPVNLLPPQLKSKLSEIQGACAGFHVISTVCGSGGHSWNVAGTHRTSLHCANKAADIKVDNYSCAYDHLRDWRGGMSIDPRAVGHVHLSYAPGSHEFGAHFCHHGPNSPDCPTHRYAGRHRVSS